jgi:hypothetical protein
MPITFLCVCLALVAITLAQNFTTAKFGLAILAVSFIIYLLIIWNHGLLKRFALYRKFSSAINGCFVCLTCILFTQICSFFATDRLAIIAQIGLNGQIVSDCDININNMNAENELLEHCHSQQLAQRQRRIFPEE